MPLIILDRDGVINYNTSDYVKSPDEWVPIPGSLKAIAKLNQAGYRASALTKSEPLLLTKTEPPTIMPAA